MAKVKVALLTFLLLSLCVGGWAGKLEHVIKDMDFSPDWEKVECIEGEEHLFIELAEKDWNKILIDCGGNTELDFIRGAGWDGSFCIKCRLIPVSCAGNDWFRYEYEEADQDMSIEKRVTKLEVRLEKAEEDIKLFNEVTGWIHSSSPD